jgi:SecD/SecF fusion protein
MIMKPQKSFRLSGKVLLALAPLLVLCGCGPAKIEHGVEFVITVGTNHVSQVSSNEMRAVVKVLQKRMESIGCPGSVEGTGSDRISVKIDPDTKEQVESARFLSSRAGLLEFRLVHEESEKLLRDGIVPAGYELLNQPRAPTVGQKTIVPQLVGKASATGMAGQKFSRVTMSRNAVNRPEILFEFDQTGAAAFERVTTENVGRQLAIVLDREICSAPRIASPITGGHGSITGAFDEEEARNLITVLKYPLETPTKVIKERKF